MAGRISEEFINEVRSSVNIVDVVSQYVSLEKRGKDYVGLCPFHQEKTPSFTVSEGKQFFKCFGCGKGGNVFKFMMLKDNLTFPESVEQVANFAHIPMPSSYSSAPVKLNPLNKMHQEAAEFYHRVLMTTKVGQRGLAYANARHLDENLLNHFNIGYAPKEEIVLVTYLRGKGYSDEELMQSGLFVQSKDGQIFDRFRDRLMFPLCDESGYCVAFSGRRLSQDKTEAKYMNSPETSIFTKSKLLFNFANAKKAARREGHLVLYEGYMDVIAAYKAGVESGIASMGTSLTDDQVYMLRRVSRNIIINYDGDDPGINAAERASTMFKQAGNFNLGIVILPEKLDPDEYVQKYGPEKYRQEIKSAMSPTDFYLLRLEQKYNLNNDRELLNYLEDAVNEIATLPDPVAQDLYIEKLAKKTGVSTDSLKVNLTKARRRQRRSWQHTQNSQVNPTVDYAPVPEETDTQIRKEDPAQERLLYLFIHSEKARRYLLENRFLFPDEDYAKLMELWLEFSETHENPTVNSFLDFVPEQLQSIISSAEMDDMPQDFSVEELDELIKSLSLRKIDSELNKLKEELGDAKRRNDEDEIIKITQQVIGLQRKKMQG